MRVTDPSAWRAPCSAEAGSIGSEHSLRARPHFWELLRVGVQQQNHKRQEKSELLYQKEVKVITQLHLEQSGSCISLELLPTAALGSTISHFHSGIMQERSQSQGQGEVKKGHYSQPDMDEPSLTQALGKHCALCSVILFHIPLVLITFFFAIYPTDWLEVD